MKKFFKRFFFTLATTLVLVAILFALRVPILKGIGYALIHDDPAVEVDAAFVLSSNAYERSRTAADLYHRNLFPTVITLGEGVNQSLKAMGIETTEAEVSRTALLSFGVDTAAIRTINRATSTYEESEEILGYADREDYQHIMIISSKFHTKRVKKVFEEKFKARGIEVLVKGADPLNYEIDRWWESEEALIFVNNEYIKRLYYWWKY
ncbi:MAG: YdcF family protein [Bacteroidota bacterium]